MGRYASVHRISTRLLCKLGRVGGASHMCSKPLWGHFQSQAGSSSMGQGIESGDSAPKAACPKGAYFVVLEDCSTFRAHVVAKFVRQESTPL